MRLPFNFTLSALEEGSLEEDDDLHDLWVRLTSRMQGWVILRGLPTCDVSIACSAGQVWQTGVTTLQQLRGILPDEQP